ncbi:hypothetical protein [Vibrio harveyi]|uniref:hypothetical protein n=1 Tax=Vibrio harveyi TaxID=669 RepID=UPI0023808152|nr:hypothetical protein [Vibrio harveyi]
MKNKHLLSALLCSFLVGCQSTPKDLTSDININSNFKSFDIPADTYLLVVNKKNSEHDVTDQTEGPSRRCAETLVYELDKMGFERVYSQRSAKYTIGFNCNFRIMTLSEGHKATANYSPTFSTSQSRITSTTGAGAINVSSSAIGSRVSSLDIQKTSTSMIYTSFGIGIYENHNPFSHRDRELLWNGSAISSAISTQKDKRVAHEDTLVHSLLEQFRAKKQFGDIYGHQELTSTLPWESREIDIMRSHENELFLYTMELDESLRANTQTGNPYFFGPWQTIYDGGRRITYEGKPDKLLSISAQSMITESQEMVRWSLNASNVMSLHFNKQTFEPGTTYEIDLYDGYESRKISIHTYASEHLLKFRPTEEILSKLMSSSGHQKDFITIVVPDINLEVQFRKEGFSEAVTITNIL